MPVVGRDGGGDHFGDGGGRERHGPDLGHDLLQQRGRGHRGGHSGRGRLDLQGDRLRLGLPQLAQVTRGRTNGREGGQGGRREGGARKKLYVSYLNSLASHDENNSRSGGGGDSAATLAAYSVPVPFGPLDAVGHGDGEHAALALVGHARSLAPDLDMILIPVPCFLPVIGGGGAAAAAALLPDLGLVQASNVQCGVDCRFGALVRK